MPSPRQRWDNALVILADGARPDVMDNLVRAGEMPAFKKHFSDAGGFRTATSVFPTVSGPAHLPVLCGAHPGRANLPGIRWAERPTRGRSFLGRTRSYMAPWRSTKLQRDVPGDISTLFSHVPHMADINTWFVRGCPAHARRTRFSKVVSFARSFITRDWWSSDRQSERALVGALRGGYRSAFAVFPAIDELGHRFGPTTDESLESYRRFDASLGRIMDELARLGRADRTLVMITSDHGQSATHTHIDLDDLVAAVFPRTLCYPKLWRHLFSAEAAVMVSGNSMANVYLRGPDGWQERPDVERDGSREAELCARLIGHQAIQHIIYRRVCEDTNRACHVIADKNGKLVIEAPAGRVLLDMPVTLRVEGSNPLGPDARTGTLPPRDLDDPGHTSRFPDAVWQVLEFFRSTRAGDVIVCAKQGFDLRSRFEYQPHNGSHGCLDREHMLIPAAVNARWGAGSIRSVDLFPSLLNALGRTPPSDIDGEHREIERP